jgi:hypothetical protein
LLFYRKFMTRRSLSLLLLLSFLPACARQQTGSSFSAIWNKIDENGLADLVIKNTLSVQVDGRQFRILSQGNEMEVLQVFNGKDLFTQRTITADDSDSSAVAVEPASTTLKGPFLRERPPVSDVAALKFWNARWRGRRGDGGLVAGRDTWFYRSERKEKETVVKEEAWVDTMTGVVLRGSKAVYATSGAMILRTTYDCVHIQYERIEPAVFAVS